MYIPAVPMTPSNVRYLLSQREAALVLSPPPDFPGAGGPGEMGFYGQIDWDAVAPNGLQAMGMGSKPWEVKGDMTENEKRLIEDANKQCFE
jgi:hypothetical protein